MATATIETPTLPSRLLAASDLAPLFNVPESRINRWAREGQLPRPIRVGRAIRWTETTIREFIANGGEPS